MGNETLNAVTESATAADAWLIDGARTRDRIGNAASDNMRFGFIEGFKAARLRGEAAKGEQQAVAWRRRRKGDGSDAWVMSSRPANMADKFWLNYEQEALYTHPQPVAGDAALESLIEESEGLWIEDSFRIEARELMNLLRAASALSAAAAAPAPVAGYAVAKLPAQWRAKVGAAAHAYTGGAYARCADALEAALAQDRASQGAAAGVPEGWRLVPVEPTEEMVYGVDEEVGGHCYWCSKGSATPDDCRKVWAAMLATAPSAPTQGAEREGNADAR